MDFSASLIHQGQLTETRLQIQNPGNFQLQTMKGVTVGKIVHFYDLSPLVKREGTDYYESSAKIIFVKVPEAKGIQDTVSGQEVSFYWGDILVEPTEAGRSLIFGTFSVPERTAWVIWLIAGLLGTALVGFGGWRLSVKMKRKREEKNRVLALKNEILNCRNYEDVVNLWTKKHTLIKEFPHIKESFMKMEDVLNRYQFRPRQTETEKIEVVESYRKFSRSVEGGFNGI